MCFSVSVCPSLCCDVLSCGGEYSVVVCSVIYLESVMFKGDCMGVILHQVSQGSDSCIFLFHKAKTFHAFHQFIHFSICLAENLQPL